MREQIRDKKADYGPGNTPKGPDYADPVMAVVDGTARSVHEDIDATPGLPDALRAKLAEQLATPQDHEE